MWCDHWTLNNYARRKKVRKLNFVIARFAILIMDVSTELWHIRIGCFNMPRSAKSNLEVSKGAKNFETSTNEPRHSFSIIYLLVAEGIEYIPGPQTGCTRGDISPRGGLRVHGRGCNCCGSGRGSRQDPIDDVGIHLYAIPLV